MPAALRRRKWWRRASWVAGCLVLLISGLWLARKPVLQGISRFLVVEDRLVEADLIYVLNGGVHSRPFRAAELYERGLAPRVVIPRVETTPGVRIGVYPNQTDASVMILQRLGVPRSSILILEDTSGGVTSTLDEALALRRFAAQNRVRRVIVVTSAFHTRRSRWTFEQALDGTSVEVLMAPAADYRFNATDWWTSEEGLITHVNEYLKLAFYVLTRRGGSVGLEGEDGGT